MAEDAQKKTLPIHRIQVAGVGGDRNRHVYVRARYECGQYHFAGGHGIFSYEHRHHRMGCHDLSAGCQRIITFRGSSRRYARQQEYLRDRLRDLRDRFSRLQFISRTHLFDPIPRFSSHWRGNVVCQLLRHSHQGIPCRTTRSGAWLAGHHDLSRADHGAVSRRLACRYFWLAQRFLHQRADRSDRDLVESNRYSTGCSFRQT